MSRPPAKGSCVLESSWKSMELMNLTGLRFQMWMKSGGWKPSEVTTGWRAVSQMMPMWPTQTNWEVIILNLEIQTNSFVTRILNILSQSTIWFWIKKEKVLIHAMPLVAKKTRTVTTIHRGLGPSSVSLILKLSRIHGALRFLGVKSPIARWRLKMSNMSWVITTKIPSTILMALKEIK